MPVLYHLHLSRHVAGMVRGPVKAMPAKGFLSDRCAESGALVVPDESSVRECLPAFYRKAFDRTRFSLSRVSGQSGFHIRLRGSRGQYLNTIYAIPHPDSVAQPVA